MLTAERIRVALPELRDSWTLLDLADAHDALDVLEQLADKAAIAAKVGDQ